MLPSILARLGYIYRYIYSCSHRAYIYIYIDVVDFSFRTVLKLLSYRSFIIHIIFFTYLYVWTPPVENRGPRLDADSYNLYRMLQGVRYACVKYIHAFI